MFIHIYYEVIQNIKITDLVYVIYNYDFSNHTLKDIIEFLKDVNFNFLRGINSSKNWVYM